MSSGSEQYRSGRMPRGVGGPASRCMYMPGLLPGAVAGPVRTQATLAGEQPFCSNGVSRPERHYGSVFRARHRTRCPEAANNSHYVATADFGLEGYQGSNKTANPTGRVVERLRTARTFHYHTISQAQRRVRFCRTKGTFHRTSIYFYNKSLPRVHVLAGPVLRYLKAVGSSY